MTERALKIFVAGTVKGCTDLQNANFMKYHATICSFDLKAGVNPTDGHRLIGISPFITQVARLNWQKKFQICKAPGF